MKRIISILSILFVVQCVFAQEVKLVGKLTKYNASNNDSVTLVINSSLDNPIILKSPISKKGEFSFKYTENSTNYCEIYLSPEDRIPLFLSSGDNVSFSANATAFSQTGVVVGSIQTEALQKNLRTIQGYKNESENLKKQYEQKLDSLEKKRNQDITNSITNNPYLLSNLAIISSLPIEEYFETYYTIDTALLSVYPSNVFVEDFHSNIQRFNVLREGSTITDIILADKEGKMINLESFRGKVVLVDFWASWCRPCRMKIPNFKKLYETYHQDGFDIFSISVDNDDLAWKKALSQEQMPWTNVRDDKKIYSNMFTVSSIPFTILIDKDGKIVAKGLRGFDLDNAISKTLGK